MNKHEAYENSTHMADHQIEDMTFNNPFQVPVLEGVCVFSQDSDLQSMVILSSN